MLTDTPLTADRPYIAGSLQHSVISLLLKLQLIMLSCDFFKLTLPREAHLCLEHSSTLFAADCCRRSYETCHRLPLQLSKPCKRLGKTCCTWCPLGLWVYVQHSCPPNPTTSFHCTLTEDTSVAPDVRDAKFSHRSRDSWLASSI